MNSVKRKSVKKKNTDVSAIGASQTHHSTDLSKIDFTTASLMVVAGLVSGWMSYSGAVEIFNDPIMAFGFTIVVQGVVTLALWFFAEARGFQRALLTLVWAVAVTFSIGTAFVKTDKASDGADVAAAISELEEINAIYNGKILKLQEQIKLKEQEANDEELNGGCGPICKGLKAEANAFKAKAEFYESNVKEALTSAEAEWTNLPSPDLASLARIYYKMQSDVGDLADGVPSPKFITKTSRSAFDRIAEAWGRLSNEDAELAVSTFGAFWVASLMELLAVACAMIRLASRMVPSTKSMEEHIENGMAWLYDLKTLPHRISHLAKTRATLWNDNHKPKTIVTKSDRTKSSQNTNIIPIKNEAEYWSEGLHAQAEISCSPIDELIRLFIQDFSAVTSDSSIDAKKMEKHAAIQNVLMNTGVITPSKSGFATTEKWSDWNNFLFAELRNCREKKPPVKAAHLRRVA